MKSLSFKLGVILIGLSIFGYVETWGADWILHQSSQQGKYYYDAKGITRPSENIVRVWTKIEFTDEHVINLVKGLGEKFKDISYGIGLNEINCSDRKWRILTLTYYSKEGNPISTSNDIKWESINPNTITEELYKIVCK